MHYASAFRGLGALSCPRQACTRGQARLATPNPRRSAPAEFPPYDRGPVGECFQLSKGALARQILHSTIRRGDYPLRGQELERGSETLGNIPPAEAEARYYAALEQPALAA